MHAAAAYAVQVDAANRNRPAAVSARPENERWDRMANLFVQDPRRELDPNLAAVAEYVRPDDTIVDVGGGAGRVCLPLAARCREVVNVEPSPGMGAAFEQSAREAGITNARVVQAGWPAAGTTGDLTLVFNVTYFVREIVPFIEALAAASHRRVLISVWSVPPPAQDLALFELVMGRHGAAAPGYRELLPVLWDLDILPDVRVLPNPFRFPGGLPQTREEAVDYALQRLEMDTKDSPRERAVIEDAFTRLFRETEQGFLPLWRPPAREMLITWETSPEAGPVAGAESLDTDSDS